MIELSKRGYAFTGLDISRAMLDYSLEMAKKAGIEMKTIHADMRNFKTREKFDFVFVMLGSIEIETNSDFLSHLDSMANCLKKGGIYLIDAAIQFDWTQQGSQSWSMTKNDITANVTVDAFPANYVQQQIIEKITIEAIESGRTKIFKTEKLGKIIFPQEFLELVAKNGKFEFLGWFSNFDLAQPLEKATCFNRPMPLLRRK